MPTLCGVLCGFEARIDRFAIRKVLKLLGKVSRNWI
jgi:hypothetical protein